MQLSSKKRSGETKEISEQDIQEVICEYLALKKYFFWRQNTMALFDSRKKVYRRLPRYAKTGVSDIILVRGGKIICLEVKRPGGKLSQSQKDFRDGILDAGGQYDIVTSVEDVEKLGY